jgi:hypothetical protein
MLSPSHCYITSITYIAAALTITVLALIPSLRPSLFSFRKHLAMSTASQYPKGEVYFLSHGVSFV